MDTPRTDWVLQETLEDAGDNGRQKRYWNKQETLEKEGETDQRKRNLCLFLRYDFIQVTLSWSAVREANI